MMRGLWGISKVEGGAPSRSVTAGSSKGDTSVLGNGYVGSGGGGGLAQLGPLRM
jgi:hypothetical protein